METRHANLSIPLPEVRRGVRARRARRRTCHRAAALPQVRQRVDRAQADAVLREDLQEELSARRRGDVHRGPGGCAAPFAFSMLASGAAVSYAVGLAAR